MKIPDSIIPILSLLTTIKSQLCAYHESYCLSGLIVGETNDLISTQYILEGILNDCPYFKALEGKYLYWFPEDER